MCEIMKLMMLRELKEPSQTKPLSTDQSRARKSNFSIFEHRNRWRSFFLSSTSRTSAWQLTISAPSYCYRGGERGIEASCLFLPRTRSEKDNLPLIAHALLPMKIQGFHIQGDNQLQIGKLVGPKIASLLTTVRALGA